MSTQCDKCKLDAAEPSRHHVWPKREQVCGTSNGTQPMWACRFGRPAFVEYHESHEHVGEKCVL